MYLISVYFDNAATKRIQTLIEQIAAASGNHYMTDKQVPPHLTVSAIEARSVDVLFPAVQQLNGRLRQGSIQFVTVGQLFPYVLYTMPVLNAYLQDLALQVGSAVSGIPETAVSKYYHPRSWLPHVSLMSRWEKPFPKNKCGWHLPLSKTNLVSFTHRSRRSGWQR